MPRHNYIYTKLKQDGTTEMLHTGKKWEYKDWREAIGNIIETIPDSYYPDGMKGLAFGDEEARYNEDNHTNPHFKVLKDLFGDPWDIVGDVILEQTEKQYAEWQESKK